VATWDLDQVRRVTNGILAGMDAIWPAAGLTDGSVLLRRWQPDDSDQFVALFDHEVARWSPQVSDQSDAALRGRLEQAASMPPEHLSQGYAIVEAERPDHLLGAIDWRTSAPKPPFSLVDIGYLVGAHARGRGVATAALRLLGGWLLSPRGGDLRRIQLDHAVANAGSCRVAEKAGLTIEGRRPQFLPLRDTPGGPLVFHDTCLHGRVRPARTVG
jgi:RimJ/RimL family protein N-acetyltransferase